MEITGIDATTSRLTTWGVTTEDDATTREPISGSLPEIHRFSVLDYTLFAAMLAVSALIGVYFAFFAKQKQNTTSEYLMGGKKMGITPVSMSLIASCISGITILSVPAEIYVFGTQFCTMMFGFIGAFSLSAFLYLPVFHGLQLSTSYEYLEMRFDRKVRMLGSLMFLIYTNAFFGEPDLLMKTMLATSRNVLAPFTTLYIPVVIYLPALAFGQVTGISNNLVTPFVCLVCIFYTSLGGLKAVVWTDTLQTAVMFFSTVVIIILGTFTVGGVDTVWSRNVQSGRIEIFNLDPDATARHTFWNTIFGYLSIWLTNVSVNQGLVQRFLAVPSLRKAKQMMVILTVGVITITALSSYCGLVMYSNYYDCDRLSTKIVRAPDQLLPYFVMDMAGSLPGLPGLFMAGVFSAALSSMSTGLNSVAGVIYKDFICQFSKVEMTEGKASFIMKTICVLIGLFCFGMVYVVQHLGAAIQRMPKPLMKPLQINLNSLCLHAYSLYKVANTLKGVTTGPTLAIFTLGMFIPWTNSKGVLCGGIAGLLVMGYITIGSQLAIARGLITYQKKPLSTQGCAFLPEGHAHSAFDTAIINATVDPETESSLYGVSAATMMTEDLQGDEEVWYVFRISYTLYTIMGLTITIVVGLVVSFLTGPTDPRDVHIELLTPVVRPLFAHRCKSGDEAAHWKKKDDEGEELKNHLPEVENLLKKEPVILTAKDDCNLADDPNS